MSNYRVYFRSSNVAFDGVTLETADYTQFTTAAGRYVFRTDPIDVSLVGQWAPTNIGRSNVCSLINVVGQDAANPGDTISVISSLGELRYQADLTPQGSGFFFMWPEDRLVVDSGLPTSINILVSDLDDDQLDEYINGLVISGLNPPLPVNSQKNITVTATQVIPAYAGELIVHVQNPLATVLTLPTLAATSESATITFVKESGAGTTRIIADAALTPINGQTGIIPTEYFLRSFGDSITYLRVGAGWQRKFGEQVPDPVTSAADPILVPRFTGGNQYVFDNGVALGNVLQLDPVANYKTGCRITVINNDVNAHEVLQDAADLINNSPASLLVPAGSTFTLEAGKANNWIAVGGDISAFNSQDIVAADTVISSGGNLVVNINLGADADITLPLITSIPFGSKIYLINIGGVGIPRIICDNALDLVNGVAGIQTTEYYLRNVGDSVTYTRVRYAAGGADEQWHREFGAQAPGLYQLPAPGLNILPEFKSGTLYVTGAPGNYTIELPSLSILETGCRVCITTHVSGTWEVQPNGADTLIPSYIGTSYIIAPNSSAIFEVTDSTGLTTVWAVIGCDNQYQNSQTSAANIVLASSIQGKTTYIEMTGGAAQTLTLPALTSGGDVVINPGTRIVVFNNTAADTHDFIPDGLDEINGVNANFTDAAGKVCSIEAGLPAQGWFVIQGA